MTELNFEIEFPVLQRFPACQAGGFLVSGLREAVPRLPVVSMVTLTSALAEQGIDSTNLADDPRVREWRQAIGRCGLKPSAYKSSPEQLAGRLLRGKTISTTLPLVDCYNSISVRYLTPVGAYDVERLPTFTVRLREARGTDSFQPLGASPEGMPLKSSIVVYAVESEVICWAFNHRDSVLTCLRPNTDTALFLAEAVSDIQAPALRAGLAELAGLLASGGATVGEIGYASVEYPRTVFAV